MKHGSDWYKREPAAYLGGVQGLTSKEHAVYSVTLELIYAHGGSVNNDPGWIAGWIKDMGQAAVRKTIEALCDRGKLMIEGDQITQKRAKSEAKTKENVSETARENGRKGGKKSAELRRMDNKVNDLGEATASSENQPEKIREEKIEGGGGSACAREDFRGQILEAMGHDPTGITANGKIIGKRADFEAFRKACDDLSIPQQDAVAIVSEVTQAKRDGPAQSMSYFIDPLRRFAGVRDGPRVVVANGHSPPRSRNPTSQELKEMLREGGAI